MPGDNKAVTRNIAVIVLVLLAIVALRGYLPGAEPAPKPAEAASNGAGSYLAVLAMLAVSFTVIAISIVAQARRRIAAPSAGEPPREYRSERTGLPWRLLLIAAVGLLAWLLVVVLLMRWGSDLAGNEVPQTDPNSDAVPETGRAEPTPPETPSGRWRPVRLPLGDRNRAVRPLDGRDPVQPQARRHVDGDSHRRRRTQAPTPPAGPDLARAAELGLAEIGDLQPRSARGDHRLLRGDGTRAGEVAGHRPAGFGHPVGGAGPRRRAPRPACRQRGRTGRPVRGGAVQPACDERGPPRGRGRGVAAWCSHELRSARMTQTGSRGSCLVVAVQLLAHDRSPTGASCWWVAGAAVAVCAARCAVVPGATRAATDDDAATGDAGESLRRWLSRTETLISLVGIHRGPTGTATCARCSRGSSSIATGQRAGQGPDSVSTPPAGCCSATNCGTGWIPKTSRAPIGTCPVPGARRSTKSCRRLEQV